MALQPVFFTTAVLILPEAALACSCAPAPPLCEQLASAPVAFIGTVIEEARLGKDILGSVPALVKVEAVLRGIPQETSEVRVRSLNGTTCDVEIRRGERWLILGGEKSGIVLLGACSNSRRIGADDHWTDRFVQSFLTGPNLVMGSVRRYEGWNSRWRGDTLVRGAEIRLSGDPDRIISTGADGTFAFYGVEPGTHRISIRHSTSSAGTENGAEIQPLQVSERGCVNITAFLFASQSIRGTVTDREGKPLPGMWARVHMVEDGKIAPMPSREVLSRADGTYELPRLNNGRYAVSISPDWGDDPIEPERTYFLRRGSTDNQATHITLDGEGASGIDLTGTAARIVTIPIRVLDSAGEAVPQAAIDIRRNAGESTLRLAGSDGKIDLRLIEGDTYVLSSFRRKDSLFEYGTVRLVAATGAMVEIRLKPRR